MKIIKWKERETDRYADWERGWKIIFEKQSEMVRQRKTNYMWKKKGKLMIKGNIKKQKLRRQREKKIKRK